MITALLILLAAYLGPTIFCLWYTWYNPKVDKCLCFKPKKWASFALGFVLTKILKPHIIEQLILRIYNDEICRQCYLDNKCIDCGCDRGKFLIPYEQCLRQDENGDQVGWGEMYLKEQDYTEHRKLFPVEIKVEIKYKNNEKE